VREFLPRSQISLFCLGYILSFTLFYHFNFFDKIKFITGIPLNNLLILNSNKFTVLFGLILLISFLLLIIFSFRRRILIRNLFLILLGLILGLFYTQQLIHSYNTKKENIESIFQERILSNHIDQELVSILPIKAISGRYYLVQIDEIDGSETKAVATTFHLPIRANNELRSEMICPKSSLKLKNVSTRQIHYEALRKYGSNELKVIKKKCKIIANHPFPNQIAKNTIRNIMEFHQIQPIYQGIALGLLFGESSNLSSEIYESAKESGTLHLFAASGLHLGILLGSLFFFFKNILKLNFYLSLILPLVFGLFYLNTLNYPVSLSRAYYFAIALVFSKILFRNIRPIDLLVVTSFLIIFFKADSFLSVGFNLSFSAVAGIFFIKPKLDQFIFHGNKNIWSENLTVSLSAILGTFCSTYFYFSGYSFGGLLANLFLVPLTGLLLPILYTNVLISYLQLDWISIILWPWTDLLLRTLTIATEFLSKTISFYTEWSSSKQISLYYYAMVIVMLIIIPYCKSLRWLYSILSIFIITSFFVLGYYSNKNTQDEQLINSNFFTLLSISEKVSMLFLNKELYVGGYCKSEINQLKKKLTMHICQQSKSIRIDHDSCMPIVRKCYQYNKDLLITFSNKRLKDWSPIFPDTNVTLGKKNSLFQISNKSVLLYKEGWDPKWLPKAISKMNRKGILVLLNDANSNPNSNNLNSSLKKKSLGLASDWTILDKSEFARFSLLQSQKNPRSLGRAWGKPTKILGTELSH
jgi:ComEC/Rec2-related protein